MQDQASATERFAGWLRTMTTRTVARTKPASMDTLPATVTSRMGHSGASRRTSRLRIALALLCASTAAICAIDAGWIHAKAALAQRLLEHAWQRSQADGDRHRPWPWADTRPIARLRAPRLRQDQIVLAGDSGRALAFGPGWAEASAPPNARGVTVISGHRDTHFAWLRKVVAGDTLQLETRDGGVDYAVASARIVDSRHERIDVSDDRNGTLVLVTCWPFDAVVPGGPMRYVITARRIDPVGTVAQRLAGTVAAVRNAT